MCNISFGLGFDFKFVFDKHVNQGARWLRMFAFVFRMQDIRMHSQMIEFAKTGTQRREMVHTDFFFKLRISRTQVETAFHSNMNSDLPWLV